MSTKKNKTRNRFPRIIEKELHKEWRSNVRTGDPETLAKLLEVSKPTIDKALIYGNVHQWEIVEAITEFFMSRISREKLAADQLKEARVNK